MVARPFRWLASSVAVLVTVGTVAAQKPADLLPRRANNVCDSTPGSTVLIPFERLPPPKGAAAVQQPAAEESEPQPTGQQPLQNLLYFPELVSAPCPEGAAQAQAPQEQIQLSVMLVELDRRAAGALKLKAGEDRLPFVLDNGGTQRKIAHLRDAGRARVLAEPTLLTGAGQNATFFVGGQMPVMFERPDGGSAVTFVPLGLQLQFKPTVEGKDRLRLELRAQISKRGEGLDVQSRSIVTTVELRPGQTLALSGLDVDGNSEKALVLVVTPRVVRAAPADATPPAFQRIIYQVADVAFPPAGCKTPLDERSSRLVNAIVSFVDPERWQSNGGKATVDFFPQTMTLVVGAPEDLQAKVSEFLETLRRLTGPTRQGASDQ